MQAQTKPWRARPRKPVNWYRDHRLWIMALVLPVAFTANGVRQLIQRLTAQLEGIASLLAAMVIVGLVTLYLRRPVDEGWDIQELTDGLVEPARPPAERA